VVVVRRRRTSISLLFLVYLVIGVIIAVSKAYITATLVKLFISAVLAVLLWPLVLLGINLRVG
jgi:predicted PurR-regulated permease PerM